MYQQYPSVNSKHANFNNVHRDQYNICVSEERFETMEKILERLDPANMDPSMRPECLGETRSEILRSITDWAMDPFIEQNVLWLHGLVGSGKSAIATTLANHFHENAQLGAFLFFSRDVAERRSPANVIRTLAYQLGTLQPHIGTEIAASIEKNPSIILSSLKAQFQSLMIEPSSSLEVLATKSPILLILDGLDECGTSEERVGLLEVLSTLSARIGPAFRFVITGDPEMDICVAFESQEHIRALELDITSPSNNEDISSFLRHEMEKIRKENKHLPLGPEWPGEDVIQQLTEKTGGLIVWAVTAVNFIDRYNPVKRMEVILKDDMTSKAQTALDSMYRTALKEAWDWEDEDFVADFRAIFGVILVAQNPLSSEAIDDLLGRRQDQPSIHTISHLRCVLQQHPTVRVLHPSFTNFLLDRSRCRDAAWFFDKFECHHSLATRCLRRLDEALRQNMYHGFENEVIPEDVAYACAFWVTHICMIEDNLQPVVEALHVFLHRHLLHWFEAMIILRKSKEIGNLLQRLLDWIKSNCAEQIKLQEFVCGAQKCAETFITSASRDPFLVYMPCLPLAPLTSTGDESRQDDEMVRYLSKRIWPPVSDKLNTMHEKHTHSVAGSYDGTRIVSGRDNGVIQIWDAISGDEVVPAFEGHDDKVLTVAFSPDGTRVVSGSADHSVRVWSTTSGTQVLPSLEGHKGEVSSVVFSPNGDYIASGSEDKTIRIWDARQKAEAPALTLRGHTDSIECVAFSCDGTRVVSGSADMSIRVWDATNGNNIRPVFQDHLGQVNSVAFSPDMSRIVSGSTDKTIRIWDVTSGVECFPPLRGHSGPIWSVTFSPDGARVVSGSGDKSIRIWDAKRGKEIRRHSNGLLLT